jgi:hypothetical protein
MNGSYRGINFNRARMAPQQVAVPGGTMRPNIISAPTMREALMQQVRPQPVAEILSEGLPEMMPDLGGASSTADRKREIADLLTQRAMGRNATSIGTGLAQLGEAFIARGATKRADEAETTRDKITRDLLATAMGGGPDAAAARAQIEGMTGAPAALAAFDARQAAEAEAAKPQYEKFDNQIVQIGPDGVTPVYTAPQAPTERWEPIDAPAGIPGYYERSTTTGETRRVAGPPDAGVTVYAGDVAAGQRPIVDKPDKGFQRVWDEASQSYRDEPIPGGNTAREREEEAYREYMKLQTSEFNYDNVTNEIDRAIELTGPFTAGVGGALLKDLPMTSARTLNNAITMVKSNLGFDRLQQMREESKTGGALGAVTEKEIDLLQSTVQRLDQLTDPAELIRALQVVKEQYIKVQSLRQRMYSMKYSATEPGQSRPTPAASTPVTSGDLPPGFEMVP